MVDARGERRLGAMRLDVLAGRALPRGDPADVALTAQWATFICWVDDQIDRRGLGSAPGELERFTAPLRRVLAPDAEPSTAAPPHAVVLAGLWERTAAGMSARWRARFTADYTDFLDACEQEAALRRAEVRLPLAAYLELRRRTITLLPMLDVLERTGHAELLEDPRVDDRLRDLRLVVADVAGWANDLASAADDEAAGQDNLMALLARRNHCSTGAAGLRAAAMVEERRAAFRTTAAALRATPGLPQDRLEELRRYVDMVETFMAATLHWLAVTGRFAPDSEPPTITGRPCRAPDRHSGDSSALDDAQGRTHETRPDDRRPPPLARRRLPR
ncbi:terpene synthase family protein [Kitasatospora sp. NBC_00039]|uniref:terpene synthase family protein n=1 Tax=Kitasatospora sp. NBC_00039 TaxID=2903565 RepID=UPI0032494E0B